MGLYVNTFVIEIKSPLTHKYWGGEAHLKYHRRYKPLNRIIFNRCDRSKYQKIYNGCELSSNYKLKKVSNPISEVVHR